MSSCQMIDAIMNIRVLRVGIEGQIVTLVLCLKDLNKEINFVIVKTTIIPSVLSLFAVLTDLASHRLSSWCSRSCLS